MKNFDRYNDVQLEDLIECYSERKCGNCAYWMLKHLCKREEDHIVSMNEYACAKFEIKGWHKTAIAEYEQELTMRNI